MNAQSIFEASRNGDLNEITTLFNANNEIINAVDNKGFTPLILAAYSTIYRNTQKCSLIKAVTQGYVCERNHLKTGQGVEGMNPIWTRDGDAADPSLDQRLNL